MALPTSAARAASSDHPRPEPAESERVRALFHITASSDSGVLPRLIEPVAKLGHTPTRVHASRESGDGSLLAVDLRLAGLERAVAERVARSLRTVVGVQQVISVIEAES